MADKRTLRSRALILIGVTIVVIAAAWKGFNLGGEDPPPPPPPPTPPPPAFVPPQYEILVASLSGNALIGFDVNSNDVPNPNAVRVIGGSLSTLQPSGLSSPYWLAVDAGGRIFTTNLGDQRQPSATSTSPPRITVHEANANGATAPFTQFDRNVIGYANPRGLVVRRNPFALFIANSTDAGEDSVLEVELPNGGPAIGRLSGVALNLTDPAGIALNSQNYVYVADAASNRINVYAPRNPPFGTCTNCVPVRTLAGDKTLLDRPVGLAFDSVGRLYVTNFRHDQTKPGFVSVFAPDAQNNIGGNVAPTRLLGVRFEGSTPPNLRRPVGIALGRLDRIFVSQEDEVLVFDAGATGNAAPQQRLTHPRLSQATGLVFRD